MKLFLTSTGITQEQRRSFLNLVGKEFPEISFALIENAADPYPEERKGFVYATRELLDSYGMKLKRVNLSDYKSNPKGLRNALQGFDVVWIGGGNIFYIRWLMKETGFDSLIKELVAQGVVYAGGSAGAIVATETLKHFDLIDNPKVSPEQIYTGLGLTNLVILPHWGVEKFQQGLNKIKSLYESEGGKVITMRDGQAVVVNGQNWKVEPVV